MFILNYKTAVEVLKKRESQVHETTVKEALNLAIKAIEEVERLEKRLENAVFTDTDYTPKPKRTFDL
jgi:20S proteasome alpha/beta subunit